jgi:hypothetical protein
MELIPPDLALADSEERLHEVARQMTGLEDFGGDDYREALGVLLRSFDEDADLTPGGRLSAFGIALTALAGRLQSQAGWRANPGYRDLRIEAPIVILGLPRTGTTALQRMLCELQGYQGLELWLAQSPQPRPPRAVWGDEPGYQRCEAMLETQHRQAPEMSAIHEMKAAEPDECWNLLRQSFASVTFECVFSVSSYSSWWAQCDMRAAYARWADNLRLIGLKHPEQRWVLKDPSHLFAPEALLAEFPDATIVMTHRDPAKSIPSVCSLNAAGRAGHDRVQDDSRLGAEQLELWWRGTERMMAARERYPDRFVDVHFHDFVEKPLEVARSIVERVGGRLGDADERAVRAWQDAHPSKSHRYDAGRFGLQADEIRERYVDYIECFDVRIEEERA